MYALMYEGKWVAGYDFADKRVEVTDSPYFTMTFRNRDNAQCVADCLPGATVEIFKILVDGEKQVA